MARKIMIGMETGDMAESLVDFGAIGVRSLASGAPSIHGGNYVISVGKTSTGLRQSPTVATPLSTAFVRFYYYIDRIGGGNGPLGDGGRLCFIENFATGGVAAIIQDGNGQLEVWNQSTGSNVTVGFSVGPVSFDAWNLIELKVVVAAGTGIIELKLNGVIQFTATGLTTNGRGNIDTIEFGCYAVAPGYDIYFDDIVMDDAAYPGDGKIIGRQWVSTLPTYNGWTKSTGSTIDTVWNDTPTDNTTSANSGLITGALAQTADVASFSLVQAGNHGSEIINSYDTINGIKVGAYAFTNDVTSNGNLGAVRYRLNGVDTDTNQTITASTAYYESAIFNTTLSNINILEAGWNKQASLAARQHTVNDAWIFVDYTPSGRTESLMPQICLSQ